MKKAILLFLALILTACSTSQPQVTVTSEVTVTLPPPTATETLAPPTYTATPANETVTLGGVTMTLDENGVVTDMSVEGNYTDAQKAEKLAVVDPTKWGYEAGETQIRVEGPINRFLEVIDGTEVVRVAKWDFGSNQWLWDGTMMEHIPLFDGFAKTVRLKDGHILPEDQDEAYADAAEIRAFAIGYTIYLYDGIDKTEAIIATYSGDGKGNNKLDPNAMLRSRKSEVVDGMIGFKTKSGKIVKMKFKDIEVFIRGFN